MHLKRGGVGNMTKRLLEVLPSGRGGWMRALIGCKVSSHTLESEHAAP